MDVLKLVLELSIDLAGAVLGLLVPNVSKQVANLTIDNRVRALQEKKADFERRLDALEENDSLEDPELSVKSYLKTELNTCEDKLRETITSHYNPGTMRILGSQL